jgi:murein DD-endopeptidase MepM/ murein hydrolase activator NlpD
MRLVVAILGVIAFAAVAVMASASAGGPLARRTAPTPTPRLEWPAAAPTEQVMRAHLRLLSGFRLPLDAADLPSDPAYLPNSPRDYRAGYHEGIDFAVKAGTPVLAAKDGTIARIDSAFADWSAAEAQAAFDAAQALGFTPEPALDRLRGRQVWIDHGDGIVTRYAHLSAVAPLRVGDPVARGDVVGAVGSSGFPEGGPHLHFEIRDGQDFYGDGLPLPQLRYAISAAFR